MSDEIEVKYKGAGFARVRRALRGLGAAHQATVVQTDSYFDTPDGAMRRADEGLRLRRLRYLRRGRDRSGERAQLTFKGPTRRTARVKIRREVQTHVDCPAAIEEILRRFGLAPVLVVQKRRASYRLGRCTVELDELPLLGRFVEIEGPGERAVHSAAEKLALPGEPITDHYVNLLARRCPRVGRTCREVTFDRCTPDCKHR